MSAIAGILNFGGAPVKPGCMERVTAAMAPNGPDGISHWQNGPVALGHCMLRTTPETIREVQPLAGGSKNLVLIMEGRLDNREELERSLGAIGALRGRSSDAELVLRAYEVWGESSPQHLLGDFAYAIWDSRRQRMFCAVDQMGACQIYYVLNDRFFAFASTEESLLALEGVSGRPNEHLIAYLLVPALQIFERNSSWLHDVKILAPGQLVSVTPDGNSKLKTYWQLQPGDELQFGSEDDARRQFEFLFREAVHCRLPANGSVAHMLSGGLDSASIRAGVSLALRPGAELSYRTYSAVSDEPQTCIETQCIQSLATNVDASFVNVPSFSGMVDAADLVQATWSNAHPCDNSIVLPALMCLAAHRRGDRVMLHGASGDVTSHVPNRYPAYFIRSGKWKTAWTECQQASRNNNYLRGTSPFKLLLLNAWTAGAPLPVKSFAHRVRPHSPHFSLEDSAINPDFAKKHQIAEQIAFHTAASRALSRDIQADQAQVLTARHGLALGLGGYARLGKRYGLEMRDPWADRRVVEYFLRLPLRYKIKDGWTKYMVRTSFDGLLEPKVRWRLGKEHLGWQCTQRVMGESQAFIQECFERDLGFVQEFVDTSAIKTRLGRYLKRGKTGGARRDDDCQFLYDKLAMILWLKRISLCSRLRKE